MNRFDHIRKWRKVPAKRNMPVLYRGSIYRIAAIGETGSLVLRAEHLVHPTDPELNYDYDLKANGDPVSAIRRHIRECEKRIADRNAVGVPDVFAAQQAEELAFMNGLKRALEHMGVNS
jgi:uncharacterized NAD(P)/FAD-binding protein YdhS